MKPTVYIETTIPSYLTARPSRDLIVAAHQQETKEWWDTRDAFELYISRVVFEECSAGNPTAAALRVQALQGLSVLDERESVTSLAAEIIRQLSLPTHAQADALHIGICAVHRINYLLTWNCTHLANANLRSQIDRLCKKFGYDPPTICTPTMLKPPRRS